MDTHVYVGLFWTKGHPKGGFEGKRILAAEEAEDLATASRALAKFVNRPIFVLQSETYRAVRDSIVACSRPAMGIGPGQRQQGDHSDLGNRLALWLQATRMFLDQTETRIKRGFGGESPEWESWNSTKQGLHRDSVAYSLLYEVRNALHTAPVPVDATQTASIEPDGSTALVGKLRLNLRALESDKKFAKWLRNNSIPAGASLDISQLATDMQQCMEELKRAALILERESAGHAASTVAKYAEEAYGGDDRINSWPVTFAVEDENPTKLFDLTFLPIDLLSHLPEREAAETLTVLGGGSEETVGDERLLRSRSYRSWGTKVSIVAQRGGQTATADARLWTFNTGPGWGGTIVIESGHLDPGPISIRTAEGRRANAVLDSVEFRAAGELAVFIGTLVGIGPAPSASAVSNPYRDSVINDRTTG